MKTKYDWVENLDAEELKKTLLKSLEDSDDFKKMILGMKQLSHVELLKNTKGTNIGVKVYHEDPTKASVIAQVEYDNLVAKYEEEDCEQLFQ